jgi:hypothetical protein
MKRLFANSRRITTKAAADNIFVQEVKYAQGITGPAQTTVLCSFGSTSKLLAGPYLLVFDTLGDLVTSDSGTETIRKVVASSDHPVSFSLQRIILNSA